MAAEPAVETAVNRETLLISALELFDEVHCPVCDTEWDPAGFRQIVANERKQLQEAVSRRSVVEAQLAPIIERIETAASALNTASRYGPLFIPPIPVQEFRATSSALAADAAAIKRFLPLAETVAAHSRAISTCRHRRITGPSGSRCDRFARAFSTRRCASLSHDRSRKARSVSGSRSELEESPG